MVWILAMIIGGLLLSLLTTKGVEPSSPKRQE